jgi:hypothetical protein
MSIVFDDILPVYNIYGVIMFENNRYTKKNRPRRSILNSTLKMRKWYNGGAVQSPFTASDNAPLPFLESAEIPKENESPPPLDVAAAPADTLADTTQPPTDTLAADTTQPPTDTLADTTQPPADTLADTTQPADNTITDTTQPLEPLEAPTDAAQQQTLNIDYNEMMNTPDIQAVVQTLAQKIADYIASHMPKQ